MQKGRRSPPNPLCLAFCVLAVIPFSEAIAADAAPRTEFRDCPHCPEMVVVPAGEFVMGSSKAESGHAEVENFRNYQVGFRVACEIDR